METKIRRVAVSLMVAFGLAVPAIVAIMPVQSAPPTQSHIVHIADDDPTATPTPHFSGGEGGGGCGSGGCPK